jgi:DNA polymerase I-like protein with 3'-5' exonuclease and polymerase domains
MVNTIHDSFLFDVKEEAVVDFILDITEVLADTHKYFERTFAVPLALKLKAGASYGVNWHSMKDVEL